VQVMLFYFNSRYCLF